MILALMFTCGWRRSRPLAYSSSAGSAAGTSVMLKLLVIESAVTAPRTGQLAVAPTTGTMTPGTGAAPTAPLGAARPAAVAAEADAGQLRERRSRTIGASIVAFV